MKKSGKHLKYSMEEKMRNINFGVLFFLLCKCISSAEGDSLPPVDFHPGFWFEKCPSIDGWAKLHQKLAKNAINHPDVTKQIKTSNFAAAELRFYNADWSPIEGKTYPASYCVGGSDYFGFISGAGVAKEGNVFYKIDGRELGIVKLEKSFQAVGTVSKKYEGEALKKSLCERVEACQQDISLERELISDVVSKYKEWIYKVRLPIDGTLYHSEKSIIYFFRNFFRTNDISQLVPSFSYAVLHMHTKLAMCACCLTNISKYFMRWKKECFPHKPFSIIVSCEQDYEIKGVSKTEVQKHFESECSRMSTLCCSALKDGYPDLPTRSLKNLREFKNINKENIDLFLEKQLVGQFFLFSVESGGEEEESKGDDVMDGGGEDGEKRQRV